MPNSLSHTADEMEEGGGEEQEEVVDNDETMVHHVIDTENEGQFAVAAVTDTAVEVYATQPTSVCSGALECCRRSCTNWPRHPHTCFEFVSTSSLSNSSCSNS